MSVIKRLRATPATRAGRLTIVSIFSVLAMVVDLVLTRHGLAYSQDSTVYSSVAENWSRHGGLSQYDGSPLTQFPPGFSLLLGALLRSGMSLFMAGRVLEAGALGVFVVAGAWLGWRVLGRFWWGTAVVAALVSTPLIGQDYAYLWSESVFVAGVSVFLLFMVMLVQGQRWNRRLVAGAVGALWVCEGVRYMGVDLLGVAFVGALMMPGSKLVRLARAGWFSVAGGLVFVAVGVRNLCLGTGILGPRLPTSTTVMELPHQILHLIGAQVQGDVLGNSRLDTWLVSWRVSAVFGVVGVSLFFWSMARAWRTKSRAVLLLGVCVVLVWTSLVYSSLTAAIFVFNNRLVSPSLLAFALCVVYGIIGRPDAGRRQWRWGSVGVGGAVALLVISLSGEIFSGGISSGSGGPDLSGYELSLSSLEHPLSVAVPQGVGGFLSLGSGERVYEIYSLGFYCPMVCVARQDRYLERSVVHKDVHVALWPQRMPGGLRMRLFKYGIVVSYLRTTEYGMYVYRLGPRKNF